MERELKYDSTDDTIQHKKIVSGFMSFFIDDLQKRSLAHDMSKLSPPEKDVFDAENVEKSYCETMAEALEIVKEYTDKGFLPINIYKAEVDYKEWGKLDYYTV